MPATHPAWHAACMATTLPIPRAQATPGPKSRACGRAQRCEVYCVGFCVMLIFVAAVARVLRTILCQHAYVRPCYAGPVAGYAYDGPAREPFREDEGWLTSSVGCETLKAVRWIRTMHIGLHIHTRWFYICIDLGGFRRWSARFRWNECTRKAEVYGFRSRLGIYGT